MDEEPSLPPTPQILIVEDEVLVAMSLVLACEDAGFTVLGPVGSVVEALALLERSPTPDAAILDVNLADRDVYPVADLLVDHVVPLIFHTGHATEASIEAKYPSAQFHLKPTLPEVLVTSLKDII